MKYIMLPFVYRFAAILALGLSFATTNEAQVITTIAGTGSSGFSGDGGPATAAQISGPTVVAFDASGNLYFPDYGNSRIRKISTAGVITTVVGNGTPGYSGDGGPATAAQLNYASFVTFHGGEMYIADYFNHVIRKVSTSGIITTVAGNGSGGLSGDGGPATSASFYYPASVAFDRFNNMFVVDEANDRVRKVVPAGTISTFAGGGSSSASGVPATTCALARPGGITVDSSGNIYFTDVNNARICKVNTSGTLTVYAGTGSAGYSGDGGAATAATLNHPLRLVMDAAGTLYFGDQANNRARKVTASGVISTIAGTGSAGFSGDGGLATAAQVYGPQDAHPDGLGNIYITDADNNRIRKISGGGSLGVKQLAISNFQVYPNPNHGSFTINIPSATNEQANVTITNTLGQKVKGLTIATNKETEIKLDVPVGIYFAAILINGEQVIQEFVVQ